MPRREEPTEVLRTRLGFALQGLASDLAEERRRRIALEREVRELRRALADRDEQESRRRPRP
jgi:hypothetical protein